MGTGGDEGSGRRGRMRRTTGTGGDKAEPPPQLRDGNGERARGETASIASRCSVAGGGASRGDGGRRRVTVLGGTDRSRKTTTPPLSPLGEARGTPGTPHPPAGRTRWATRGGGRQCFNFKIKKLGCKSNAILLVASVSV